jgi:predicted amidohydrolase
MAKIAAAQVAPAFLDLERSLEIAESWIGRANEQGVELLVFPETWLSGYPFWLDTSPEAALWDHPPAKRIFRRLYQNSVELQSDAMNRLCEIAAAAGLTLVMGVHERIGGSLYNSMVYISDSGKLLGVHRKLVPTYTERMIWGRGDGSTLLAVDTAVGRLGGLVCWEHWMPLARQAMHQQGEVIHAAVWPWVHEVHLLASRSYAFEGRCFVVAAGSVLWRKNLPENVPLLDELEGDGPWLSGGSSIIGPDARIIAGPAEAEETLVVAEIDPDEVIEGKLSLDVAGHYSRPDVFTFNIDDLPRQGG